MTEEEKLQLQEEGKNEFLVSAFNEIDGKALPVSFKVSRQAQLQLAKVERDLFTDQEELKSGNYIISGLQRIISEMDFQAFSMAAAQILYNQSYQSKHADKNSGISERVSPKAGGRNMGEIIAPLNQLCRYGYGEETPTTQQKKAMNKIIDALDSNVVTITFANGDTLDTFLCKKMAVYTRKEDGAKLYNLVLNPVFCENVTKNFAELPQDITKRLSKATKGKRKTASHYRLTTLLSRQDKRNPFVRTMEQLLEELWLTETYKTQRVRTEKQLVSLFDVMKEIGMITSYSLEYASTARKNPPLTKVTFYLNKDLNKVKKQLPEETQEAEEIGGNKCGKKRLLFTPPREPEGGVTNVNLGGNKCQFRG